MSKYLNILKFEYFHLVNAPYKIISILLYVLILNRKLDKGYTYYAEVVEDKYFYDGDAVLFRTSRWHSVENKETKSRIICSFMLNSLMLWEDIVENFKANRIIE